MSDGAKSPESNPPAKIKLSRREVLKGAVLVTAGAVAHAVAPEVIRGTASLLGPTQTESVLPDPPKEVTSQQLNELINNINILRQQSGKESLQQERILAEVANSTARSLAAIKPVAKDRKKLAPIIAGSILKGIEELTTGTAAAERAHGNQGLIPTVFQEITITSSITAGLRSSDFLGRRYPLIEDYQVSEPQTSNYVSPNEPDNPSSLVRILSSASINKIGVGGAVDDLGNRVSTVIVARISQ